jgi:hypothetical protein
MAPMSARSMLTVGAVMAAGVCIALPGAGPQAVLWPREALPPVPTLGALARPRRGSLRYSLTGRGVDLVQSSPSV